MTGLLRKYLRLLASLKVAIPLLILLTVVTIAGSLLPTPALYSTYWYLGLLGLLGLSLLLITIQHAPLILKRKGRNAMIGVIATHLGILVVIGGIIYGGFSGFRHQLRLVEGEVSVVPGLPFVIRLDEIEVEEYRREDFPRFNLDALPKKRQDSHLTLLKGGKAWVSDVAAPARPLRVDGVTLLPSVSDIGRAFDLVITDPLGKQQTIPVRPWAPPMLTVGGTEVMAHQAPTESVDAAELLTRDGDQLVSLGIVTRTDSVTVNDYRVSLGAVRGYTGMQVYSRPQDPVLVWGSILMFVGLVWHFYFRHRDRRREGQADA